MGLFSSIKDYLKHITSKPAELPEIIFIPNSNTDRDEDLKGTIQLRQHYFTIRINEMFLKEEMEWLRSYDPVVLSISEYNYNGKTIEQPFIAGSNMMKEKLEEIPRGMLFNDTRVAGILPFTGGKITTTFILCKAKKDDLLRNAVNFIEKVSGLFNGNISKLFSSYTSITSAVMDSVDILFKRDDLVPVMGYRKEFDVDSNDMLTPGYFVLINKTDKKREDGNFYVKKNKLFFGKDLISATIFRDAEYVLFSITKSDVRSDYDTLPIYQSYLSILENLKSQPEISEEKKKEISGRLSALNIDMKMSPDLTQPQAKNLMNTWYCEIKEIVDTKFNLAGSEKKEINLDYWDKMQEKIISL